MWDVVEHLRDPSAVLAMLRRYLAPGGLLVLETGNYENWLREAEGDDWSLYLLDHHFYFTPSSLEKVTKAAGYSSFEVMDAGRITPPKRWIINRPIRYLSAWGHYVRAKRRWPEHGDINVMIAVAGA